MRRALSIFLVATLGAAAACLAADEQETDPMALPTTRNTTYAVGSQVKHDDLNDLQDKIVDQHTKAIAAQKRVVSLIHVDPINASPETQWVSTGGRAVGIESTGTSPPNFTKGDLPIWEGETVDVSIVVGNDDAMAVTASLKYRLDAPGTIGSAPVTVATVTSSIAAGMHAITIVTGHAVPTAAGFVPGYYVEVVWGAISTNHVYAHNISIIASNPNR